MVARKEHVDEGEKQSFAYMMKIMGELGEKSSSSFGQSTFFLPEQFAVVVCFGGFPIVAGACWFFALHWTQCAALLFIWLALVRAVGAGGQTPYAPDLSGKTAIVTGANCGIGFATARRLALWKANVVLACRDKQKGEDAVRRIRQEIPLAHVMFEKLDLSSMESVCDFTDRWHNRDLHMLINNAGVMMCPYSLTKDGFEWQFGVNHLAHFVLTMRLLPNIRRCGTRIVNLSSVGHALAPKDIDWYNLHHKKAYAPGKAYGWSKLANILFGMELNRRYLKGTDALAVAVHPGGVRTELARHFNAVAAFVFQCVAELGLLKTPDAGAQTSLYCATAPADELKPGAFYADCAEFIPTKHARDKHEAIALFEASEDLAGAWI